MIEIKTYTNVWNADRKIYRFQDLNLPMPISFKQIGLFFLGAVLWLPIAFFLPISITNSWGFIITFAPPIGLALLGDRPIFGGKTIIEAVISEIRFWFEPKFMKDYEPSDITKESKRYAVSSKVWYSLDSYREIGIPSSEETEPSPKRKDINEVIAIGNKTKEYEKIFNSLNTGRA